MTFKTFQVDCGAVYYDPDTPTNTLTGLDHLEGETVAVLVNGQYVGEEIVSFGKIRLVYTGNHIIVGIPYDTLIKTLHPDAGAENGTAMGRKIKVTNPVLYFFETGTGVQYGPDEGRLKDVPDLVERQLSTLKVPVSMPGGFDTDGQIVIKMDKPLPMYLSSISYDVEPSD